MAAKAKKGGRKSGDNTPEKHRTRTAAKHPGSENLKEPWQPGQSGNPAGRPKGSRNKLSEQYLASVCAIYDECGDEAVRESIRRDPEVLIKVVMSLLPKKVEVEGKIAGISPIINLIGRPQPPSTSPPVGRVRKRRD